jgi:hypothetical protein
MNATVLDRLRRLKPLSSGGIVRLMGLSLLLLLSGIPVVYLMLQVSRFRLDCPYMDEWSLVPLIDATFSGKLSLALLFRQHNEHRLFFPNMIYLAIVQATGWDLSVPRAVCVLLAAFIFIALVWQVRMTARHTSRPELIAIVPVISLIVFSLNQWENWFQGMQICVFLNILCVICGYALLAQPVFRWHHFTLAAVLGIIASYSFANGLIYWPVGLLILFLAPLAEARAQRVRGLLWVLVAAAVITCYFCDYRQPPGHPSVLSALHSPLKYGAFILAFVGSPLFGNSGSIPLSVALSMTAGAMGIGLLCYLSVVIIRRQSADTRMIAPYIGLACYSVLCGAATGAGRLSLGVFTALAPRYICYSSLLWIAVVVLVVLHANTVQGGFRFGFEKRTAVGLACVGILALISYRYAWSSVCQGGPMLERVYQHLLPARNELLREKKSQELLSRLYPEGRQIEERLVILKKYRLCLFHSRSD